MKNTKTISVKKVCGLCLNHNYTEHCDLTNYYTRVSDETCEYFKLKPYLRR